LIEVRLFGDLWRYAEGLTSAGSALYLPAGPSSTVGQVLAQVGIDPDSVSNVFVNGCLLPRSTYPITLGLSPGLLSTPFSRGMLEHPGALWRPAGDLCTQYGAGGCLMDSRRWLPDALVCFRNLGG
jgi:hypothetical protein